jgi:hypothetical protein
VLNGSEEENEDNLLLDFGYGNISNTPNDLLETESQLFERINQS